MNVNQADKEVHTLSLCQDVWIIIFVFIREVAMKKKAHLVI